MFPRLLPNERGLGLNVGGEAMNLLRCSSTGEIDCVHVCVSVDIIIASSVKLGAADVFLRIPVG